MSKYVLVSDIHGDGDSLEQVVSCQGSDMPYLVLGDLHGLKEESQKVMEILDSLDTREISGNHDKALFEYGEGHVISDELSREEFVGTLTSLSVEQVKHMLGLEHMQVFVEDGERICMAHAFPWPEQASGYETGNAGLQKKDLLTVASKLDEIYDFIFTGHTHVQYEQDCSKFGHDVHFVNPGSLGWNNEYAVVDIETGNVSLCSISNDDS